MRSDQLGEEKQGKHNMPNLLLRQPLTNQRGYRILQQWRWQDLFASDSKMKHLNLQQESNDVVVHQVYPLRDLDLALDKKSNVSKERPTTNVVPESTLHWLMHPWLRHECSQLEAGGFITHVQSWIDGSNARRAEWRRMQASYSFDRWGLLVKRDQEMFESKRWSERFNSSGVGGMRGWEEGPVKLKCLHLHYAHYLAQRAQLTLMTEETDGKMVENISELNMNMAGKRVHEEIIARHA